MNVAAANTESTFNITDIELMKDSDYAITMNTTHYYNRKSMAEETANYPVVVGNIQINAFKFNFSLSQIYPTETS